MKERRAPASDVVKNTAEDVDWQSFKRARIDALFLDFKEWLVENVEDDARVPKCEDATNDDKHLWVHKDVAGKARANNSEENTDGGDDEQEEDDEESTDEEEEEDEDGEDKIEGAELKVETKEDDTVDTE